MSMLLFLRWALAFFLFGFLIFLVTPFVVGMANLPMEYRKKVARFYFGLSMTSFDRVLCYVKPNNECKLIRPKWDDDHDTEKVEIGETERHYEDPANKESRLINYPFSFVLSNLNKINRPMDALVGKLRKERIEGGDEWLVIEDEEGNKQQLFFAHELLPRKPTAVNLQDAKWIYQESHQPDDVKDTVELVKKSQQGFKTTDTLNMILILGALGGGSLLGWFIWSNTDQGGGSVVEIPISTMAMYLLEVAL